MHPLVLLSVVDHFRRCDEVRASRARDGANDDGWMRAIDARACDDGWLDGWRRTARASASEEGRR